MNCAVCGGEDFEKHAGFMYCATCQTQSLDYYEQEYDYHDHEANVVRQKKSLPKKTPEPKPYDGNWTSWEAFNYILHGMTNEIKKCGATGNFDEIVLKLWIAYLKECQIFFLSRKKNTKPKLGLCFKQRDARLLYNCDLFGNPLRKKRKKSKSCSSKISNTSNSSVISHSKRSQVLNRSKIIMADYQEKLSQSKQNSIKLADESLELLGKSSELEETTELSSDGSEDLEKVFKHMLRKKDYKVFKKSYQSGELMKKAKEVSKKNVRTLGKNKLLSIIHLALLMTGSQIQLSDLLRFIRESHLSFAKVTHFFPREIKFPKRDVAYIESVSDILMPTHLQQRRITSQLAYLLKVKKISTPDMNKLVDRYCEDLNLPKQIGELSKKVLANWVPLTIVPRLKTLLPNFEAWAMVSIIFIIKLLFGLNDRTEIFLSRLAREINSVSGKNEEDRLFVFEDWQKFLERRKKFLTDFHYPTQEQLGGNYYSNSKKFLAMLTKESKDEYRSERFIPYSGYYIEENLLSGLKQTLRALSETQNVISCEFQPSLIPQVSHTETIIQYMSQKADEFEKKDSTSRNFAKTLPKKFLQQNFRNCDLGVAFDPKSYFKSVKKISYLCTEFDIGNEFSGEKSKRNLELLFNCSSKYWVFEYPNKTSRRLANFKIQVLKKTPQNFQWLITECARMLEMNVRDLYNELLRLEKKFRPITET